MFIEARIRRRFYSVRRIKEKELRAAGAPAGAGQEGKRKGGKEGKEEGFRSDLGHNHTFLLLQLGFLYLPLHSRPALTSRASRRRVELKVQLYNLQNMDLMASKIDRWGDNAIRAAASA